MGRQAAVIVTVYRVHQPKNVAGLVHVLNAFTPAAVGEQVLKLDAKPCGECGACGDKRPCVAVVVVRALESKPG